MKIKDVVTKMILIQGFINNSWDCQEVYDNTNLIIRLKSCNINSKITKYTHKFNNK